MDTHSLIDDPANGSFSGMETKEILEFDINCHIFRGDVIVSFLEIGAERDSALNVGSD